MSLLNTKATVRDILSRNYDPLSIEEIFFLKAFVQGKALHVRQLVNRYIQERMYFPNEFKDHMFLEEVNSRSRQSTSWKIPRMDSTDELPNYDDVKTDYTARLFITPETSLPPESWYRVVHEQPTLTGIDEYDESDTF